MSTTPTQAGAMHRFSGLLIVLCVLALGFTAPARSVTFTTSTLIDSNDTSYDNQDIVVQGCTVTINGPHTFNSLHLTENGQVGHGAWSTSMAAKPPQWTVSTDVTIDAGCAINVSGAGYAAGAGPGAGTARFGDGGGNAFGGGGGHAGPGGIGDYTVGVQGARWHPGAAGGTAYGSVTAPTTCGSGGGSGGWGGSGGGIVRLIVNGRLTLNGGINANGAAGGGGSGGGAGGGIYLTTGAFAGSGIITANGGSGTGGDGGVGGNGGGGHIAVVYNTSSYTGTYQAYGPGCAWPGGSGGAGTVYLKPVGQTATVLVDNNTNATSGKTLLYTMPISYICTVKNAAKVQFTGAQTLRSLHVYPTSAITFANGGKGITLTVQGDALIDQDAMIDVAALGYAPGAGPGAGHAGVGDGWGTNFGGGGGHGGVGGTGDYTVGVQGGRWHPGTTGGGAYDAVMAPANYGSGGGSGAASANGGNGGGVVRLAISGALTVNGAITADGAAGTSGTGGGAGGSIYLTLGTLTGNGAITAIGGRGTGGDQGSGGNGSGGRIAIIAGATTYTGIVKSYGPGGAWGDGVGAAGTIYYQLTGHPGTLIVENNDTATTQPTPLGNGMVVATNDVVNVKNRSLLKVINSLTIGSLHIAPNSTLTFANGGKGITLAVQGDAQIDETGSIDVAKMGYAPGAGPGAGRAYYTDGWGTASGGGGGHGGHGGSGGYYVGVQGGQWHYGAAGGDTNDARTAPLDWGSGGGAGTGALPHGGGAVRLIVNGTLTVNGVITADGENSPLITGAGAGGSIFLTTGKLTGSGNLSALGGNGYGYDTGGYAGGGGGGRIAVYSPDLTGFPADHCLVGGGAGFLLQIDTNVWINGNGDAGTVYFGDAAYNYQPDLWIGQDQSNGAGNGVYSNDGAGETITHTVDLNIPTIGCVVLQNAGNIAGSFNLLGSGNSSGWTFRYIDTDTGQDVTTAMLAGDLNVTLPPGGLKVYQVVITGSIIDTSTTMQVTATSMDDAGKVDVIKGVFSCAYFRPDLAVRKTGESSYTGEGTYNNLSQQTKSQNVLAGVAAKYYLKVTNGGSGEDTCYLMLPSAENGWMVQVFDDVDGVTPLDHIDPLTLAANATHYYRVEVTPSAGVADHTTNNLDIAITSENDNIKTDTVRLATQKYSVLSAVNLTAAPATAAPVNTPITLTATPAGGLQVEYKFRAGYQDASGWHWSELTNYQSTASCVWTPATAHTYTITAWAREVGHTANYDVYKSASYTVYVPISAVALRMAPASPQLTSTPITLTATPTGGYKVEYKFRAGYQDATGWHWSDISNYQASATCLWTPATAHAYSLVLWARETGHTASYDAYQSGAFTVVAPLSAVALKAVPASPQSTNTPITLTATPTGGLRLEYKFRAGYQDATGWHWSDLTNYQTTASCVWTPTTAHAYSLTVWARTIGHTANYDKYITASYSVVAPAVSAVSLQTTPASPQPANTPITFTANPTGGNQVEVKFRAGYQDATGWHWSDLSNYQASATCVWTPTVVAKYSIVVWARSGGHTANYDAYTTGSYQITKP